MLLLQENKEKLKELLQKINPIQFKIEDLLQKEFFKEFHNLCIEIEEITEIKFVNYESKKYCIPMIFFEDFDISIYEEICGREIIDLLPEFEEILGTKIVCK